MNGKPISVVKTHEHHGFCGGEYLEYISICFSEYDAEVLFKRSRRALDYATGIVKSVMR